MSKIAVWCLSERGLRYVQHLSESLEIHCFLLKGRKGNSEIPISYFERLEPTVGEKFHGYPAHLFIMATGIVVRVIAPLLKNKMEDPAVVVMDEAARHVISLISGHQGGANALAEKIAAIMKADPVITTATDAVGLTAFDTLAQRMGARVEPKAGIKKTSAALLKGHPVALICDRKLYETVRHDFPSVTYFEAVDEDALRDYEAFCVITDTVMDLTGPLVERALFVRPPSLSLGIGCNRGTPREEIEAAAKGVLKAHRLSPLSVFCIASADKKGDEAGLKEMADAWKVPFHTFTSQQLNTASKSHPGLSPDSPHAMKHLGAKGVAEPAALLAAGDGAELIIPKQKIGNVTVSVARRPLRYLPNRKGKLHIVGIGPGGYRYMTLRAREILQAVDTVVGYTKYIEMIEPLLGGKDIIQTGMTKETERVEAAIDAASKGRNVALIASGDAGVYGLAGLALELSGQREEALDIEVSPGITAAVSAAAIVGAPLTNDYITLSLSDLLTPTETVISRIQTAAASGMVTVIYNPKSRKRTRLIALLQEAFLRHRAPDTPVAIVTHALREGQTHILTTLRDFLKEEITMNSIVIIGNSETVIISSPDGPKMVTRRGYEIR